MKGLVTLFICILLTGCGVELLTTTAIVGELHKESATAAISQLDRAGDKMARIRMQSAIKLYYAETGYYPATLSELVPEFIEALPLQPDGTIFNYDPEKGMLLKGPGITPTVQQTVTSGERYRMSKINEAINEYGYATGFYPAQLQDLVPEYLSAVPRTDSGEAFVYSTADGSLYHPLELTSPSTPAPRTYRPRNPSSPVGGAGPLGEAMTSIAIQNQLGNMNTSGVNRGRSTAESSLRRTQSKYQRQQEKALRDLGS